MAGTSTTRSHWGRPTEQLANFSGHFWNWVLPCNFCYLNGTQELSDHVTRQQRQFVSPFVENGRFKCCVLAFCVRKVSLSHVWSHAFIYIIFWIAWVTTRVLIWTIHTPMEAAWLLLGLLQGHCSSFNDALVWLRPNARRQVMLGPPFGHPLVVFGDTGYQSNQNSLNLSELFRCQVASHHQVFTSRPTLEVAETLEGTGPLRWGMLPSTCCSFRWACMGRGY
jgi:hypothetical protein